MGISLRSRMLIVIFLPFFLILSIVFMLRYSSEKRLIEESTTSSEKQIEQNIRSTMGLMDEAHRVVERYWEPDFRTAMKEFQQALQAVGGKPEHLDLGALKSRLGGKFDLYAIDGEGVIRHATFSPVIGLDFKTLPRFFEIFKKMQASQEFVLDRLSIELKTGNVRLWAYQASPDKRWVLELGLAADTVKGILGNMDIVKVSENLKSYNPMLTRVQLFDVYGHLYESPQGEIRIPEDLHGRIMAQGEVEIEESADLRKRYIYVDLAGDRVTPTNPSKIVELSYDRTLLRQRLRALILTWAILAGSCLVLLFVVSAVISHGITRPLLQLNTTVKRFAQGDLAIRSRLRSRDEMGELHEAFDTMADKMERLVRDTKSLAEQERALRLKFVALTAAISDRLNSPVLAISNSIQRLRDKLSRSPAVEASEHAQVWQRYEPILSDSIASIVTVSQELSELRDAGATIESTRAMQLLQRRGDAVTPHNL